jgi:hypothetical protein
MEFQSMNVSAKKIVCGNPNSFLILDLILKNNFYTKCIFLKFLAAHARFPFSRDEPCRWGAIADKACSIRS